MNSHNLIPAQRLAAKRKLQAVRRWIVIDFSYLAMLLIVGAFYTFYSLNLGKRPGVSILAVQTEESTRALAALHEKSAELKAHLQSVSDVYARPDWSILLAALSQNMGDDVVLSAVDCLGESPDRTSANTTPDAFCIKGIGRSQQSVTRFVLTLENFGLFSQVKLVQSASQSIHDRNGVGFELTCNLYDSHRGGR